MAAAVVGVALLCPQTAAAAGVEDARLSVRVLGECRDARLLVVGRQAVEAPGQRRAWQVATLADGAALPSQVIETEAGEHEAVLETCRGVVRSRVIVLAKELAETALIAPDGPCLCTAAPSAEGVDWLACDGSAARWLDLTGAQPRADSVSLEPGLAAVPNETTATNGATPESPRDHAAAPGHREASVPQNGDKSADERPEVVLARLEPAFEFWSEFGPGSLHGSQQHQTVPRFAASPARRMHARGDASATGPEAVTPHVGNGPVVSVWVNGVAAGGRTPPADGFAYVRARVLDAVNAADAGRESRVDRVVLLVNGAVHQAWDARASDGQPALETRVRVPISGDTWIAVAALGAEPMRPLSDLAGGREVAFALSTPVHVDAANDSVWRPRSAHVWDALQELGPAAATAWWRHADPGDRAAGLRALAQAGSGSAATRPLDWLLPAALCAEESAVRRAAAVCVEAWFAGGTSPDPSTGSSVGPARLERALGGPGSAEAMLMLAAEHRATDEWTRRVLLDAAAAFSNATSHDPDLGG